MAAKTALLWKVPLAVASVSGIFVVAAMNIAPGVPVWVDLVAFALLATVFFGIVVLAVMIVPAWHRYCLNHGATDPAWMWFGGEPPGLQQRRRDNLQKPPEG